MTFRIEIPPDEIRDILLRLGFLIESENSQGITVGVPSYRFDISIEADLIEELVRVYGYDNVPKTSGIFTQALNSPSPESKVTLRRLKTALVDLDYQEVVTYSFIDPKKSDLIAMISDSEKVCLKNQIFRATEPCRF